MSDWDELAWLDASAQAELVRRKEVQPIELVDAAIERIERLNPALNAVVTPMFDYARNAAMGPLPDGPFTGVPCLLKDLTAAFANVPLTMGSRLMIENVPDHDSELVARLKRAGLIIIGKTNTCEFGFLPTTEPALFGPTLNPWDGTRSPGGSSGGSGVAVATGMVAAAHGNDAGGSIRVPASCCGVFGLKPTRARNSLGPDLGDYASGIVAEHALTRSVRDSAALLDATAGPAPGDPYCAPPAQRPFLYEVGAHPGALRIAFSASAPYGGPVHPDCVAAVHDAATMCADLGHHVIEDAPVLDGEAFAQHFVTVFSGAAASSLTRRARLRGARSPLESVEPYTRALYEFGLRVTAADYLVAVGAIQSMARSMARFLADYDVWLTPTVAEPPPALGTFNFPEDPLQSLYRAVDFLPFTPICNATGQPGMSLPLHWNEQGLPIGVHFAGRFGDEATLFRLAAQLEAARPWAHRRPPVSA